MPSGDGDQRWGLSKRAGKEISLQKRLTENGEKKKSLGFNITLHLLKTMHLLDP